ncbi:PAS domain-containing sensor histidine kinase [Candidatus Venteria ishoeyi]|uniref:histidine kinase n=1 Tax=Candidatus Venteria ishoeyi TaxID=1899563 RepID=A0A1H6FCW8_9GAMM|nr:PAS domain-containing sensor histidine kinase [Candidatus Venteria ishoeyi]MDM8545304.1 PAS domain S-box protein [Candidatus Venteria ishoeyi]SEH07930.1 Sporulation kinase E [Candidatus Venteria ishoeyi]
MIKKRTWKVLKRFFIIFSVAGFLLSLVALAHYSYLSSKEQLEFQSNEKFQVIQGQTAIKQQLAGVLSDLNYLTAYGEKYLLFNPDSANQNRMLNDLLLIFSKEKGVYDQIRYLDNQGVEVIRINYNHGNPVSIPKTNLQTKSNRYYFQAVQYLKQNQYYISPLDLNIENEKIESPYKPVLRFAKPVFDQQSQKQGTLILNYTGQTLLDHFIKATHVIQQRVALLNPQSYWLYSAEKSLQWAFMFGKETTFSKQFPAAWEVLRQEDEGQFIADKHLFTFVTVDPLPASYSYTTPRPKWKIVSTISLSNKQLNSTFASYIPLYSFMLLLLGLGAWLLAQTWIQHQQTELQVAFEQRFRQALEHINLLAIGLDNNGHLIFCNNALLKLTGWSKQAVLGKKWLDVFVAPEFKNQAIDIMHGIFNGQLHDIHQDTLIQTRDGEIRKVRWNNTLMLNPTGKTIGMTCIGEDVTEIREQEQQLLNLSRAVEQSPNVVMIVGMDGEIQYANPKFTELTGYTLKEVLGKNPRLLKSTNGMSKADYRNLWETIKSGKTWKGIFQNKKKNGENYWESAIISGIRNSDGDIINYLAVKENITKRLQLEKQLEQRNIKIAKSEALAVVGRMASMVAHDLRNPLSSIKMSLQILSKPATKAMEAQITELKKIALDQVAYMEIILEDLLSFACPSSLQPEWLSIEHIINETINILQGKIQRHQAIIETSFQTGLPTLYVDSRRIRQVLSNLISNAIQAATEAGESPHIMIVVMSKLGQDLPAIQIEIYDNGAGLGDTNTKQLCEPFYTTRTKGTGLGLAIVKRYVEEHNGTIILENNPEEKGTICNVTLPISSLVNVGEKHHA